MTDKVQMLVKGQNISLIPNWLMLNNAIRTGNLQILAKVLKQAKLSSPPLKPNAHSFIFAIWSSNPEMLDEVVKMAKKKHGMDFIPDFYSLSYAVLSGTVGMVDKVIEIASIRKTELLANFVLLHFAVWSNHADMVDKVLGLPKQPGEKFPGSEASILKRGIELSLEQDVLEAVATSGNPAMLFRIIAVAHKHNLPTPKPTKKMLCNAIKSGNFLLVDEIFKLAVKTNTDLIIDEEICKSTDWSDNPAMKSYLENLMYSF